MSSPTIGNTNVVLNLTVVCEASDKTEALLCNIIQPKMIYAKQKDICVLAATHQDLIKIIIPAIIKEFPEAHKPVYVAGDKQILKCFISQAPPLCIKKNTKYYISL